jgi:hypothetical protein
MPPPKFTSITPTQPVPNSSQNLSLQLPLKQNLSGIFCSGVVESTGKTTFDSKDLITEVEMFKLQFSGEANQSLAKLETSDIKKYKKVLKTLAFMEVNPRHPGLKTHKYDSFSGLNGEEVFEAYVENNTPGAFRVFWSYGPGQGVITILAITPHP